MALILESWRLFWFLAILASAAIGLGLHSADFSTARGTESMILHSVFCALPIFVVAFIASSLVALWPSRGTRWILANRRYVGLAFALAMAWHFSFVAYYFIKFGNPLSVRDLALDLIGLCLLTAMTLTSFRPFARRLRPANWRRLHKSGIYTLWLLPTFFYLDDLGEHHDLATVGVLCLLLAAGILRGLASIKKSIPSSQLT
jgi:methionine sulfoxide reductase heme-binding subunit